MRWRAVSAGLRGEVLRTSRFIFMFISFLFYFADTGMIHVARYDMNPVRST